MALSVPVTDALRAAAARNGGALNVELFGELVESAPMPAPMPAPGPSGDCTGCFGVALPPDCVSEPSVLKLDSPYDALTVDGDDLQMWSTDASSSSVEGLPANCVSPLPSPEDIAPEKQPDLSPATDQVPARPTWVVTHAFYLGLGSTGNGDLATAFAPVNVGTLLLGEITSQYTADAPDVAPEPHDHPGQGQKLKRATGRTFKYTAGVEAFGVTLSAQSDYNESSWIRWYRATSRNYSHLFGNDSKVGVASIVYSYD